MIALVLSVNLSLSLYCENRKLHQLGEILRNFTFLFRSVILCETACVTYVDFAKYLVYLMYRWKFLIFLDLYPKIY